MALLVDEIRYAAFNRIIGLVNGGQFFTQRISVWIGHCKSDANVPRSGLRISYRNLFRSVDRRNRDRRILRVSLPVDFKRSRSLVKMVFEPVGFPRLVLRYERERRGQCLVRSIERADRAELQFRRRYPRVDGIFPRYDGVQRVAFVAAHVEIVGRVLAQIHVIVQLFAGRLAFDMDIARPRRSIAPVTLGLTGYRRHFPL